MQTVRDVIRAYEKQFLKGEHGRDLSWEHCRRFLLAAREKRLEEVREFAALHLGFYLASWGMYRGSGFLLQHAYTIHLRVIDQLWAPEFEPLWERDFGSSGHDAELIPLVVALAAAIRKAYRPFGNATDTLITKVLLGTIGCCPACDTYFLLGCRQDDIGYSRFNERFLERLLNFSIAHVQELRDEQERLWGERRMRYPLMKLVDMYFWKTGFDLGNHAES